MAQHTKLRLAPLPNPERSPYCSISDKLCQGKSVCVWGNRPQTPSVGLEKHRKVSFVALLTASVQVPATRWTIPKVGVLWLKTISESIQPLPRCGRLTPMHPHQRQLSVACRCLERKDHEQTERPSVRDDSALPPVLARDGGRQTLKARRVRPAAAPLRGVRRPRGGVV
jgi:hypothetical protein